MKQTRIIMGMPITVEVVDSDRIGSDKPLKHEAIEVVFSYFTHVDETFSTYKKTSEISRLNDGTLSINKLSTDVKIILQLAKVTKKETNGFFDITRNGIIDPSGIVKGWAVYNAAEKLKKMGYKNFYVEAGGDIQVSGKNAHGKLWTVGIRNPFNQAEIVRILTVEDKGVATSGTYIRGQHIYNPRKYGQEITDIVSITVIGPNIYDADRFATAAFAMGKQGITFIEHLENFEGYMIESNGIATMTSGFKKY